jgi:hypothetical protein
MRLILCCFELGLEHMYRIIPLGKNLQEKDHELFFFSGGVRLIRCRKILLILFVGFSTWAFRVCWGSSQLKREYRKGKLLL